MGEDGAALLLSRGWLCCGLLALCMWSKLSLLWAPMAVMCHLPQFIRPLLVESRTEEGLKLERASDIFLPLLVTRSGDGIRRTEGTGGRWWILQKGVEDCSGRFRRCARFGSGGFWRLLDRARTWTHSELGPLSIWDVGPIAVSGRCNHPFQNRVEQLAVDLALNQWFPLYRIWNRNQFWFRFWTDMVYFNLFLILFLNCLSYSRFFKLLKETY